MNSASQVEASPPASKAKIIGFHIPKFCLVIRDFGSLGWRFGVARIGERVVERLARDGRVIICGARAELARREA